MVADLQHVQRDFQACPVILAVVISKKKIFIYFFATASASRPSRAAGAEPSPIAGNG